MSTRWTRYLATTGAAAATAVVGAVGTDPDSSWYRSLRKPPWQPPPVAFPLVWTPLYGLIAYGAGRALDADPDPASRRRFATALGVNLALNAGWCWVFFKGRSPAAGLVVIAALDASNATLVAQASRRSRRAGAALAPYAAWGGFATALNAAIWRRNR